MHDNSFVTYLNSLHSYNAQNANVFGEKNINSEFYNNVMVDNPLCHFIVNQLKNESPHLLILTGHAGDGKTSVLYQVLSEFKQPFNSLDTKFTINLTDSKKCLCIKDFSEFSDAQKQEVMKEVFNAQQNGMNVFMVANTGPIINHFSSVFPVEKQEEAKIKLIELMDHNTATIFDIFGLKVSVINVVDINNTFFASEFINKIIDDTLWAKCENCPKKDYCSILRNVRLLNSNKQNSQEFITNHYRWLSEYGDRLTIRNMTQQLSFMITGGLYCEDIKEEEEYAYLSSNLFFGYIGTRFDEKTEVMNAILQSKKCNYCKKRLRIDENLFISKTYNAVFESELEKIITKSYDRIGNVDGWQEMIKRMYMFYNIQTGENEKMQDVEDIFSKTFYRYIQLKYNGETSSAKDNSLIRDAISMMNVGMIDDKTDLAITLNRESGYVQNVQYVVGTIKSKKIRLVTKETAQAAYNGNDNYRDIFININGKKDLSYPIDLPLLDYFDDLKNGIINTNIDAQLSKGLENIKSEILAVAQEDDTEDEVTLIVTTNNGTKNISFDLSDGTIKLM